MTGRAHVIGVDVGTGNARAGVFDATGHLLGHASHPFRLYEDGHGIVEHASGEIWTAVCEATREAVARAGIDAAQVAGIGFDATCSLVVVGPDGSGLPVGAHGDPARDVIVWMDHRATPQAARINATGHRVLDYVGGVISPEMETPKLLWLKENLPQTYEHARHFFDLADFLGWRATGSLARSLCTVTCKWTYLAHENAWDASYFDAVGLGDLAHDDFARIGTRVVAPGTPLASGLTPKAAQELGLVPGTPVGAGLIDAHAGGIGATVRGTEATASLVYVFGTSACTMASSRAPLFIPGVWGPYYSAMVPGLWLNEGGQSSAGAAIAQLLALHPATGAAQEAARAKGQSVPDFLADLAVARAPDLSQVARLAGTQLVVPDFLGNRAPLADPRARAIIAGLGMARDLDSLVALYVAGLLGIGYGLRQIIEASVSAGAAIDSLTVIGGAGRHPLVHQLLADCTGLSVLRPAQPEPVLLGAAMLGAGAHGAFGSLPEAIAAMSGAGDVTTPATSDLAAFHAHRFAVFESLQSAARRLHLGDTTEADLVHAHA